MQKLKKIFCGVLGIILLQACNIYNPASNINLSDTYKLAEKGINPKISFYHTQKDSTIFYVKQARKDLSYDDNLTAQLKLKWIILPDYESDDIIDSSSTIIYDTLDGTQGNYLQYKQNIKLTAGQDYVIKTIFSDINQEVKKETFHTIKKKNAYQRSFFEIRQKGNHKYEPLLRPDDTIQIHYRHSKKLIVHYFNKTFQPPRPPYLNARETKNMDTPDSIFSISLNDNQSNKLHFPAKGIYHIQADTNQSAGLTLFNFGEDYPLINNHKDMIAPLRYIATEHEYKKLKNNKNPKEAIDEFWINRSGNPERARILIRDYYSRVERANKLFYTQRPGWKTDRGMIYIILGTPEIVYRSNQKETWIYGESARYNALSFDFKKSKNQFTNDHYTLERSPNYKDQWFYAIDIWRR